MIHPVFITPMRTKQAENWYYVSQPNGYERFLNRVFCLVDGIHTPRQIAAKLNASIFDVLDALDFWYSCGMCCAVPLPPMPAPPTQLQLKLERAHIIAEFNRRYPSRHLPWWQQLAFFVEGLLPRPKVVKRPVLRHA